MSNCQNCYNGCTETVSDQCVRYTGIDVPVLGISTGDPLPVIENALITFLTSTLTGVGVKINLSSIDVCAVVQQYLPTCGELNILELSKALVQASCNIQEQIDVIVAELAILNADYTIGCLTGVTSSSDTHAIVQAVITKLCTVNADVDSLIAQLPLYVQQSELCTLVAECLNDSPVTALASAKMLPYSPIPYYGSISNYPATGDSFDGTGAGLGYWSRVFMCNGQNGTPDLRGRVAVGATNTPSTNIFPAQTQPGTNGNPTYTYQDPALVGSNTVTLSLPQIPTHNHTATAAPHSHSLNPNTVLYNGSTIGVKTDTNFFINLSGNERTGEETVAITVGTAGQGEAHPNVQPGLAVYYIMYIPA